MFTDRRFDVILSQYMDTFVNTYCQGVHFARRTTQMHACSVRRTRTVDYAEHRQGTDAGNNGRARSHEIV